MDLDREDAGAQKDMPLEFLEEVMELREELEGAMRGEGLDRGRRRMAADVTARQREALHEAADALRALRAAAMPPSWCRKASHALGRVRYFTRFLEQVEAIEEEALA